MKKHVLISILIAIPLLVVLLNRSQVELVTAQAQPEVVTVTYEYDGYTTPDMLIPDLAAPTSDLAMHGTAWTPEIRANFALFKPYGWGTATKKKVAGDEWVHNPVPLLTVLESRPQKVAYVEFCAKSGNGAVTKPIKMDLWDHVNRFYSGNINWPANNNINCFGAAFNPPVWKQDLGISVMLHYNSPNDAIVLYKGWVRTSD